MRDLHDTELDFVYGAGSGKHRSPCPPSNHFKQKHNRGRRGGSSDHGQGHGHGRRGKGGSS